MGHWGRSCDVVTVRCSHEYFVIWQKASQGFQPPAFSIFQRRQHGCDGVSNHQPRDCLLNRLFGRRSKNTSKLRVTGCEGNSRWPVNSPHKGPVTRKMFAFDDVIMKLPNFSQRIFWFPLTTKHITVLLLPLETVTLWTALEFSSQNKLLRNITNQTECEV